MSLYKFDFNHSIVYGMVRFAPRLLIRSTILPRTKTLWYTSTIIILSRLCRMIRSSQFCVIHVILYHFVDSVMCCCGSGCGWCCGRTRTKTFLNYDHTKTTGTALPVNVRVSIDGLRSPGTLKPRRLAGSTETTCTSSTRFWLRCTRTVPCRSSTCRFLKAIGWYDTLANTTLVNGCDFILYSAVQCFATIQDKYYGGEVTTLPLPFR